MQTIFYHGQLITLDLETSGSAFFVEDGIIKKIGSDEEILHEKSANTQLVDLQNHTVLPAFIDAHSHLSSLAASFLQVSLASATSFADILDRLASFATNNHLQPGHWLIAHGYDQIQLQEKAQPTKTMLDQAFPHIAVVLQHKSGHFGVFNTVALQALGFDHLDQDGYLEETTYIDAIKQAPLPSVEQLIPAYQKAIATYASYGITTIQDGLLIEEILPIYKILVTQNIFTLDVVGYPQIDSAEQFYRTFPQAADDYFHHFRLGGYKIILDGSPQGKTAWMKQPYLDDPHNYGVSNLETPAVLSALEKAVADRRQLLAHCNGDAAVQQFLSCAAKITDQNALAAIRPVIIHAQLIDINQLPSLKKLGLIPSFFVAHCYYWGDTHIENFGWSRASKISPAHSAWLLNLPFTFHQDTPVLPPDMLQTIWCAVNRKTKSGLTLGEEERLGTLEAIQAVTINAAYQYGEEKTKGSLSPGKHADFVLLDQNPLTTPPADLNHISVLQTYHLGQLVYKK